MKLGIIGLPQTGKKTLFKILTGSELPANPDPTKPLMGIAAIRDPRYDTLVDMYHPKKETPAKIELALLPKIEADTLTSENYLKDLANLDALCHVVRAFEDDSVYHREGSVNAERDIDMINDELVLQDLVFIEKRLERLEKNLKRTNVESEVKEKALMLRMKEHLDGNKPLRTFSLDAEEKKLISGYPFLTLKSMILVLNVSDDQLLDKEFSAEFSSLYEKDRIEVMVISAQLESEVASLDSIEEQLSFLHELGIEEPALNILTRHCLKVLGLMSFFTVGEDEVRQWLVHQNALAPEAAGVIHSDLQKGFIRAELIKYDELIEHKSEAALKNVGKLYLKGKDYAVIDGDILSIRFNV